MFVVYQCMQLRWQVLQQQQEQKAGPCGSNLLVEGLEAQLKNIIIVLLLYYY